MTQTFVPSTRTVAPGTPFISSANCCSASSAGGRQVRHEPVEVLQPPALRATAAAAKRSGRRVPRVMAGFPLVARRGVDVDLDATVLRLRAVRRAAGDRLAGAHPDRA